MAMDAYQALVAAGKADKVKVSGFDGAEDVVNSIQEGKNRRHEHAIPGGDGPNRNHVRRRILQRETGFPEENADSRGVSDLEKRRQVAYGAKISGRWLAPGHTRAGLDHDGIRSDYDFFLPKSPPLNRIRVPQGTLIRQQRLETQQPAGGFESYGGPAMGVLQTHMAMDRSAAK
jgi:hypothetical protein